MNTHTKTFLRATLAAVLAFSIPMGLLAQTYTQGLNNTTLSAAVNATTQTFTITSASAISGSSFGAVAVGQSYFVDQELGRVLAVSSTTLTVQRSNTNAAPHANSARIFFGAAAAQNWQKADPPLTQGVGVNCALYPRPWINVNNGNVWVCNGVGTASGTWTVTNAMPITYNSVAPGMPF